MSRLFTPENKDGAHSHNILSWVLEKLGNQYFLATIGASGAGASPVSGRKAITTAGTAEKLVAASTPCVKVELSADLGNTNPVAVGGSGVVAASGSQEGIVLIPGNDPYVIEIDDVVKLWADVQTNGDAVAFNYYV